MLGPLNGEVVVQAGLIDRIYESSVLPELWPDVLDELSRLTNSYGGMLFSAGKALNWTASTSVFDAFDAYVKEGWIGKCPRRVCMVSHAQPTFFVEQDFWREDQISDVPFYRDFFHPRGLGWSAGTLLQMPTGDNVVFSIERELKGGPIEREHVDRLNELRPHLLRSAFISARLGLQRAQGASETLARLGLPAVVLDATGSFVEANEPAETLGDILTFMAIGQRVAFADRRANAFMLSALQKMDEVGSRNSLSFPVCDAEGTAVMVGHVMPIRLAAHDIFANSLALLFFTPLNRTKALTAELMRSLFDLTVAESRIAKGLVAGQTLKQIASDGDVSINTVRTQLRSILEKTGCSRQTELVTMLGNVALGHADAADAD